MDVFNLWFGGPFVYAGMNPIVLYVGHELCRGYFPFAWRPFSQTHIELVLMNVWATSLWLMIAFCLYKKDLFISL